MPTGMMPEARSIATWKIFSSSRGGPYELISKDHIMEVENSSNYAIDFHLNVFTEFRDKRK